MPQFFDRYINQVKDIDVVNALEEYGAKYLQNEREHFLSLGNMVYAPGKWTIKDILQHIIDTERIFAYRALRISRSDKTPLPGFDENAYAEHTSASERGIDDLLLEFTTIRTSTILLFKSFTNDMLLNEGTASNNPISPLAIGFATVGHVMHHMSVLKERYYPLIK